MNLIFWQWLGLILLIGAGSYWIYDKVTAEPEVETTQEELVLPEPAPESAPAPSATQPAE